MKLDLYKRSPEPSDATAAEPLAHLAALPEAGLERGLIEAGWQPQASSAEVGPAEALELFDISEETLIEQIEDRGYAIASMEGQVRPAAGSLA